MFFRRYLLDPLLRLAVVATVYLMAGSVFGVAVGFVAAAVIGVVVYLVLARRMLVRHRVLGGAGGRVSVPMRLLLAAIPTGMTISLLWVVLGPLPTAVLGVQGDSTEVAYLRATLIIANLPITVSAALQTMFQAAATRLWRAQRLDELAAAYWRTGLWTALITLPVLMLSLGFAEPTVVTLFGEEYRSAASLLTLLCGGLWLVALLGPSQNLVLATSKGPIHHHHQCVRGRRDPRRTMLILVPQYLAWGAGAVMILAALAATGLRLLLIRGKRIRVRDRRPLLIAFGGITLGASAALVVSHFSSTWPFYSALAGGAVLTLPVAATMLPALNMPGTAPRLANAPILRVLFGRSGPGRTGTGSTRSEDPASRTEP